MQPAPARLDIVAWVEGFDNRERLQSSVGYQAPVDAERGLTAAYIGVLGIEAGSTPHHVSGRTKMRISSVAIALCLSIGPGSSVLAATGEIDVEVCLGGDMQTLIHTPRQSVGTFKLLGTLRSVPAGGVFDMMSSQCFGAFSVIDGSYSSWGHCEYVNSTGDKVLLRFIRMDSQNGHYEFLGGTGRFSGLTGAADYRATRFPQIPGALNVCTEAKWHYSLPN